MSPAETGSRTTLSVCCLTRGPTARVAAQLAELREVADEIVVALDASVDPELAGPLPDLADVFVRYPYAEPVDRPVGWIHALCSREWIFWIDDDEIPSTALVRELPNLVGSTEVTHYHVPRRWLWGDAQTALDGPPWSPDYQLRLVQNDLRLLWFPGVTHRPIEAFGPTRFLDHPIYHTDLLLNPLDRRRAKVRHYEDAAPGHRAAGRPFNDAYYLPEDRGNVRTSPIAAEDTEMVHRLLTLDPWPSPAPPGRPLREATREAVDEHWRGASVEDDFYKARLSVAEELDPFAAGEVRGVKVVVENRGSHHWPPGFVPSPVLRLSYRWRSEDGHVVVPNGIRTPLPETLAPGSSLLVPVVVGAPSAPGSYLLELDLVHELVRWFGCQLAVPVEVRRAPRIAIFGDDERLATAAAAVMAEVAPEAVPILLVANPVANAAASGDRVGVYAVAPDGRGYLYDASSPAAGVSGTRVALLGRVGALLSDALLVRWGSNPRLAASSGVAFLDVLRTVDALLVVGDTALSGSLGGREAWRRCAVVMAAAALGREVLVVSRGNGSRIFPARLVDAACRVVPPAPGRDLEQALPNVVRMLLEQVA